MNRITLVTAALALGAGIGCESASAPTSASPEPSTTAVVSANAGSSEPARELASMDKRRPVPLLPMMANHQKLNMRDHLLAVEQIVEALAKNDFDAVQSAASRIGYSEQMGMMCQHMGAGAPGFTDRALAFHHTADEIGKAARAKDESGVLKQLAATLHTCTGCHAAFKQEVVDEATWKKRTASAVPSPMQHH